MKNWYESRPLYKFRQELLHFITTKSKNLSVEVLRLSIFSPVPIGDASVRTKDHSLHSGFGSHPFSPFKNFAHALFILSLLHLWFFFLSPGLFTHFSRQNFLTPKNILNSKFFLTPPCSFSYYSISSLLLQPQQNFFKKLTVYSSYLHSSSFIIQPIPTWILHQYGFHGLAFTETFC